MEIEKKKCASIDHINIDAITFCKNCKVYLCNLCDNFHSKLFSTHSIQVLKKEEYEIFTGICKDNQILDYIIIFLMPLN